MPNFDFMNKLRKNVLSGNDYQFVPLQRVEGANSAGLMPDGTLANAPQPEIKGLQIDENGKMYETDIEPEVRSSFVKNLVNNIGNKILGTPVGAASNIEQIGDNEFNASLSKTPRQGGFLNDIANGYRENYYQPFNINNLGQNKGWGTRLGEGFGTLGRFVDSSLGRGILAAGLSAATGYGEPLEELAIATVGRQRAKTADRLYRDQLKAQGINTDDIKGNITPEIYRNILYGQQLQDNAAYRNMMLNNQERQIEALKQYRQDELNWKKAKEATDNYYRQLEFDLKKAEAEAKKAKEKENKISPQEQFTELVKLYALMPQNYAAKGTQKATALLGAGQTLTGFGNPDYIGYDSVAEAMATTLARAGGEKGNISDSDIKRWKKTLPSSTDTPVQAQAKFDATAKVLGLPSLNIKDYYKQNQQVGNDSLGIDMGAIDAELKRRGAL